MLHQLALTDRGYDAQQTTGLDSGNYRMHHSDSCDCGIDGAIEQRYRSLLQTERFGCFFLGAIFGSCVAGILVTWLFVTYF